MSRAKAPRRRSKTELGSLTALANAVSERRLALGLTQVDLADLANVGLGSVRALEAGRETVGLGLAIRILDALGLHLALSAGVGHSGVPVQAARPNEEHS